MNENKDINIETSAFSVTLHWRPSVFFSQLCILVGLFLLWVFASEAVKRLLVVLCLIDVVSIFIGLFMGSSVKVEDSATTGDGGESVPPPPVAEDTPTKTEPTVKKVEGEIPNKVEGIKDFGEATITDDELDDIFNM